MDNDYCQTEGQLTFKTDPDLSRSENICRYINRLNFKPKSFFGAMISSSDALIVKRRQYWGTKTGWDSTKSIILGLKSLVLADDDGSARWNELILQEAKHIVNSEDLPKGNAPNGAFYSAETVTANFFSKESDIARRVLIRTSLPFLHDLIYSKIKKWTVERQEKRLKRRMSSSKESLQSLAKDFKGEGEELESDLMNLDRLEGVSHSIEIQPDKLDAQMLEQIPVTMVAMIEFACNRRFNGIQLANSLSFVACGLSDRMNDYLNFIGLTSSRKTALKAMDTLGTCAAEKLKSRCEQSYNLRPSMILDNIDIQACIHNVRIEKTTKVFHGSYGYLHFIPEHLTKDLDRAETSVESLVRCIKSSQKERFDMQLIIPNQEESTHWTLVRKSQLAKSFIAYVLNPDLPRQRACIESLTVSPPSVDQIEMYEPDLLMLKMMSASDNSSAGVAEMIEQCQSQMGVDPSSFQDWVQMIEGDMGTCLNFESLIRQRFPAFHQEESWLNVLNLPGLAHTMWNVASKVLIHHWGDSRDSSNTGLHRTASALSMDSTKLPSQKYFASLMQMIHKSHTATLVFLLKQTMESWPTELVIEDPGVAQEVIDQCYLKYLSFDALKESKKNKDWTIYNMQLRLRDFGTIVECDNAMRQGDIGRVMRMWKRWSIMAQGISGLSHYAIHLPRFITILEKNLPKTLAKAIKHSLLIPSAGRGGHWVAKDFYLEIQNFWLKYFYNHSGQGTKIERLMERFSILIPFLRELIQQMKERSGQTNIYQNNLHPISPKSLKMFLNMAQIHMCDITISENVRSLDNDSELDDILLLGLDKFKRILRNEARKNLTSRFTWGSMNERNINLNELNQESDDIEA